jgi:hypothetical protein
MRVANKRDNSVRFLSFARLGGLPDNQVATAGQPLSTDEGSFFLSLFSISVKDTPTIDIHGLANDVFGLGGREKYCRTCNFIRMTMRPCGTASSTWRFFSQREAKLPGVE